MMAVENIDHARPSGGQAQSNGRGDPRLGILTPEDQRFVWAAATLLMDLPKPYGAAVTEFLYEKVSDIPRDDAMARALQRHAEADAREVLATLRAGMDPHAHETPVEAIAHARYMRQRGAGLHTLVTIYQLGFAMFRELVLVEIRERAADPAQAARIGAAVDAYSFPFVATAMQRLAYEFESDDGAWVPSIDDPILSDPESLDRAHRLRSESLARGRWLPATPQESRARPDAEQALEEFVYRLDTGARDRGLHDRLAIANTTVSLVLADEPDLGATMLLDRSPIEVLDRATDTESRLWIASVDLPRIWSKDFFLPMAIAKGRIRVEGPVRKFLRIVPILRTAGEAPQAELER